MNLPNRLTLSRLVLTFFFLVTLYSGVPFSHTLALLLFIAASLTDYYDGVIARRDKLITNFGILMDPLADKILICTAFIAFVGEQWLYAWMAVIIVARELAITGLRLLAASKSVVLAAEGYGKHKTISQIVAIISALVLHSYPEWGPLSKVFSWWVPVFTQISIYIAVLLTLVSGSIYLWRNRAIYMNDM